jgi:hypothetical protein
MRTAQPTLLAEVFEGEATERTGAECLRRILGTRCIRQLSQESRERKVDRPLNSLDTFDGRTFLTKMGGFHLVAHDLCEMYDGIVGATLITRLFGFLAFHRCQSPAPS